MADEDSSGPAAEAAASAEERAKSRFFTIQGLRWAGLVLAALALLGIYHKLPLPPAIGYVLLPISFVLALVLPGILARRWRTPDR